MRTYLQSSLLFLLASLIFGTPYVYADEFSEWGTSYISPWTIDSVSEKFDSIFRNEDDKHDYNLLSSFIRELENEKEVISGAQNTINQEYEYFLKHESSEPLRRLLSTPGSSFTVDWNISQYVQREIGVQVSRDFLEEVLDSLYKWEEYELAKATVKKKQLQASLANITKDLRKAQDKLSKNMSIDIAEQNFKSSMSLLFAVIVGLLILLFFASVIFSRNSKLVNLLLTGSGLQFVTLFVLIIAIILFGILGILEGKELSAIISGIAGYILGKSVTELSTNRPIVDANSDSQQR